VLSYKPFASPEQYPNEMLRCFEALGKRIPAIPIALMVQGGP